MLVLAVDVLLRVSGYVVCEVSDLRAALIKEGDIKPSLTAGLPQRLSFIHQELSEIMGLYHPRALILEKLYSHYRHPTTVSLLSQVRGVILLLVTSFGVDFYEYAPTRARKSFLGQGNAHSYQVKKMAENILGTELKSRHTADAFSLVIAFSNTLKEKRLKS